MTQTLFISELINGDIQTIYIKLYIIGAAWFFVLVAMAIDFYYGMKKAKALGEFISSKGFRRSISKFVYYYSLMLFAILFDCISSLITCYLPFPLKVAPIISLMGCAALVLTEYKSVREKAEDKVRRKTEESAKQILQALAELGITKNLNESINKKIKEN